MMVHTVSDMYLKLTNSDKIQHTGTCLMQKNTRVLYLFELYHSICAVSKLFNRDSSYTENLYVIILIGAPLNSTYIFRCMEFIVHRKFSYFLTNLTFSPSVYKLSLDPAEQERKALERERRREEARQRKEERQRKLKQQQLEAESDRQKGDVM